MYVCISMQVYMWWLVRTWQLGLRLDKYRYMCTGGVKMFPQNKRDIRMAHCISCSFMEESICGKLQKQEVYSMMLASRHFCMYLFVPEVAPQFDF